MESKGVAIPLIHEHLMMPWNDLRRGDCCGHFETISDGYYCKSCDFFVHKICGDEVSESIQHPSHPEHTLRLQSRPNNWCNLCKRDIVKLSYHCEICMFDLDLYCAKYPPPEVIENSKMHRHKLTFLADWIEFACSKCGNIDREFHYVCHECGVTFHIDCVWHPSDEKPLAVNHPSEVNHSCHSLHPLKLLKGQVPEYSDGKCCLCGRTIDDEHSYHCSSCNFTLDTSCVLNPPLQSLLDMKTHDHHLFLLPRLISFTCNACGLKGDRSPYICVQCNFMIHQDCVGLPRVININRHDHRISRTSLLGIVNAVCGVCRKRVDWSCGGFSCQRCHGYVVHSKCATRNDVWNGKELEGVLEEETEDIEPYVVIDDNTIQHFCHKEHYLRLNVNGLLWEENKHCNACTRPIGLQSFYGCMDCDFILHQNCAKLPRKKRHVLHNEWLTLVMAGELRCDACYRPSNGFMYKHGKQKLDVCCASVYEPFFHPSHLHHPLYYIPPGETRQCNGCNKWTFRLLACIEDDCGFFLCFGCATLPQVVKHRVDDHPLSLCYGEMDASGKYWCYICEQETNPAEWFYTCKDHQASLHIECVLGEFAGLLPKSSIITESGSCEVVLNNSISRPFCRFCESRCIAPIILKLLGTSDAYFCSTWCTWE